MPIIYIPFSRELYDDIVRFSDGRVSPDDVAEQMTSGWVERTAGDFDIWGERWKDVAKKYAPHDYERWQAEDDEKITADNQPLVWKEVSISARSKVRMAYGKGHRYAEVKGGKIVDDDGAFSPSEWASKIAGGTSRNAWRDLWFKEPLATVWVPAQLLRDQARGGQE